MNNFSTFGISQMALNSRKRRFPQRERGLMQNWMAWTTVAAAVFLATGCKSKNAQADLEGAQAAPKEEASSMSASEPATFHPNSEAKSTRHGVSSNAFSAGGKYVVQVLVFQTRSRADALVEKLSGLGFPAYVAEVENPTSELSGTFYRVRIGDFATREEAAAFGQESLTPQGYEFWVDAKANDGVGAGSGSSVAPEPAPAKAAPLPSPPHPTPAAAVTPPAPAPKPAATRAVVTPKVVDEAAPEPKSSTTRHIGLDVEPSTSSSSPSYSAPAAMPSSATSAPATTPASTPVKTAPASSMTAPAKTAPAAAAPAPASHTPVESSLPHEAPTREGLKEGDTMQSPFAREGYYRPMDAPATTGSDTSTNTRRTLPTW